MGRRPYCGALRCCGLLSILTAIVPCAVLRAAEFQTELPVGRHEGSADRTTTGGDSFAREVNAQDSSQSATVQCGSDRRCRIQRLKRVNRARRKIDNLEAEEAARLLAAKLALKQQDLVVRAHKRYSAQLSISTLGVTSAGVGVALTPHVRLELKLTSQQSGYLNNGYMSAPLWGEFSTAYMPLKTKLTPFVAVGAFMGSARIERYGSRSVPEFLVDGQNDGSGYAGDVSQTEMRVHGVQLALGIDFQARVGARLQLGLMFRQPIYVQARNGKADYDAALRKDIRRRFKEYNRWDIFLNYGWAF